MLSKPTVLILGAGASMPYGFPSGEHLLHEARRRTVESLREYVRPATADTVHKFSGVLRATLERSIDAMLEVRDDLVAVGKYYLARSLLGYEAKARRSLDENSGTWYRTLWSVFNKNSIDDFRTTPLTIVTFNYDRSVEYALVRALKARFRNISDEQCVRALASVGPIHVHGQLGELPEFGAGDSTVNYGGDDAEVTDMDVMRAASQIKIVHEADPQDDAFHRARDAISAARRIVFLGFGYAPQNIARLRLYDCMQPNTDLYLCATGFSEPQQAHVIRPTFQPWNNTLRFGSEREDIVEFFRRFPDALL